MSEETIKNIIQKYKAGESSLEEEEFLFDNVDLSEDSLKNWSSFVKKNKIEVPQNLNERLWESFDSNTKKKGNLTIGLLSMAASIALIITLYINHQNKLEKIKKEALFNEAKSMFQDATKNNSIHRILLDDDLVIVYTKIE